MPLQLCDICGIVAPLALLTLNRWLRAALYFWTFMLTLQAFVQPVLKVGPADAMFWAFWTGHMIVFGCAVYDLVVLRFRPTYSDLGRTLLVSAADLAVIVPVNLQFGSNYAYIGNPSPEHSIPPFVQALGPWPQRAVIVVLLAVLGYVAGLVPWLLRWRDAECILPEPR